MSNIMETIHQFNDILKSFKIQANCVNYQSQENYFYYDLQLAPSTRVKDIQKYGDEISLALRTCGKPSVKIMHEQGLVRLEFVTPRTKILKLFDCFVDATFPDGDLMCLLGQTVEGKYMWMDLAKNPHMIVAGTTGSGKSTLLHNIIANLLYRNNSLMFLLDPKNIEFGAYDNNKIRSIKVGYSYSDAIYMLDMLLKTMEYRYELLRNSYDISKLPFIVMIIDEFADLIMQDQENQFYNKLCRLAQKCRASRMSLILSTQRPSVNIINGTIKANFPARIACKTSSHIDSKVILDAVGAENLRGHGDALLRDNLRFLERFQVAHIDAAETCSYLEQK